MKIKNMLAVFILTLFGFSLASAQDGNVWFSDDSDEGQIMAFGDGAEVEVVMGDGEEEMIGAPMMPPDDLKLTQEQKDKMEALRTAARKAAIPLKSDLELKQIELRELMRTDVPDKAKIASKVKEIESVKTQLRLNRINAGIDCRNVLTKEQRDKMKELRMDKPRVKKFMRLHGGGGFGPGMMNGDCDGEFRGFKWKEKE